MQYKTHNKPYKRQEKLVFMPEVQKMNMDGHHDKRANVLALKAVRFGAGQRYINLH